MPLHTIPALPEEYPLYDWQEYQPSRDALVSGTPTRYFAKEAWNAIVDSLNDALKAAGLKWDATYTTASGAKITEAYGKLTAQKFNSVRHNIDWPAPLGWAWADRKDFRGYVGREDFNGRSTHGRACDKVYPEYIIELVRKLNFLLEIMRGTALIGDAETEHISALTISADAVAGIGARAHVEHTATVQVIAGAESPKGAPTGAAHKSAAKVFTDAQSKTASRTSAYARIPVAIYAEGHCREGVPLEAQAYSGSKSFADVQSTKPSAAVAEWVSQSDIQAEADAAPGKPAEATVITATTAEVEAVPVESKPMEIQGASASSSWVNPDTVPSAPAWCESISATQTEATVSRKKGSSAAVWHISSTAVRCTVGTAWYPPVWINGGLWIRQSQSVTKNENGELVIT